MVKKVQKTLQNYLILNKFLLSLFGFKNFQDVQSALKSKQEGLSPNKKFYFTEALQVNKISVEFHQNLERYDERIQQYLKHINYKREPPIILKYFQYMAVLLTEIYLDNYFNHLERFYRDFVKYIMECNKKEKKKGKYSYPYPNKREMRKLAVWAATGSGKTIIMHINMLQIKHYYKGKFDNYLLITPNESLSAQHIKELNLSNIKNKKFDPRTTLEKWMGEPPIQVIEITKFKEEVTSLEGKTVPIYAFGKKNIIFVDEGHKGQATEEATIWIGHRKDLVQDGGFTFEYSATFGEITDQDDVFKEYALSIILDYRYKYFYEDGYGKDYNILNLKNPKDYDERYLTFALLSYYEQKRYYQIKQEEIKPFNIANPLMIFVGTYVSGRGKQDHNTDVQRVCKFLAEFVNRKNHFEKIIRSILSDNSGLIDNKGNQVTTSRLLFLKEHVKKRKINCSELFDEILKELFYIKKPSKLEFVDLAKADGEIGLKFGSNLCALINIGDTNSFLNIIKKDIKNDYEYFKIGPKSEFQESLFHEIDKQDSKINFLIGSKKFIEGWNSYRVSSMCLLNIGKKKGALVIQLFGRGIRLKGYKNLLKRSHALAQEDEDIFDGIDIPEYISILETLNIFGLNADYMAVFRENLEESGIEEYEKYILKIRPTFPSTALYIPRLVKKNFLFSKEVSIIGFNKEIPTITIDLSSKVERLESSPNALMKNLSERIKEISLNPEILSLLDFSEIYFELLNYKELKEYFNFYFTKQDIIEILQESSVYSIIGEERLLTLLESDELSKIERIQEYVIQLLKKIMDKSYRYKKFAWQKKNLKYESIAEEDSDFIPKEYVFMINANAQDLIKNIRDFIDELDGFIRDKSIVDDKIYEENDEFKFNNNKILEFFALHIHLFQPLIYKNKTKDGQELKFIKISPVNLVDSERDFIRLIEEFIENEDKSFEFSEIYLLRNPSRKGVGFFGTKNFYPDFILWIIKDDLQIINFIDPKGLVFIKPGNEKLELYKEIKKIEDDLRNKTKRNIELNSFILSITKFNQLDWKIPKPDLQKQNILFLEDGVECIKQIFSVAK
ncbi:MAG: DEAD/DEAH box helicase family protein [Promethearchaeota archaeon]